MAIYVVFAAVVARTLTLEEIKPLFVTEAISL